MKRDDVTVAILAGGRSSRMGADKALVMFGARSLGAIACALADEISDDVRVLGHGRGLPASLPRFADVGTDGGPLCGIAALITAHARPLVLVLPIDMPQLETADIHRLLSAADGALAAAYADHPLPLVLKKSVLDRLPTHGALGAALDGIGAARPRAPDPGHLENINDFNDLNRAIQRAGFR